MANGKQSTFLGHPRGLYILFFTEMWERFSYYGMRALLLLYMINYFKWTMAQASSVYKWYVSLVYLTPLLGGYLADRYLGNKRAIVIGATLMAIGHFCMAFEKHEVFYVALVFLIAGNGFFKPNMSTQVGRLYPTNDPRRDGAYTIFYMGINLGAFLSPLICGWLRDNTEWSYHAGFAAAGVGMVLGLVTYLVGLKWVEEIPESVVHKADEGDASGATKADEDHYMTEEEAATTASVFPTIATIAPPVLVVLMFACVAAGAVLWWFGLTKLDNAVMLAAGGGFACGMGAWILRQVQMAVRDRVLAILVVAVFVVFFWGAFEQAGSAMNLFADKTTNRYLTETPAEVSVFPESAVETGVEESGAATGLRPKWVALWNPVPTEWFQSINALAIFLLAPIFAWLWVFLPRRGIKLSIPAKVTIGVLLQAVAFALMWWAIQYENQPSSAQLAALPHGTKVDADGRVTFRDAPDLEDETGFEKYSDTDLGDAELHVVNGGRIKADASTGTLDTTGVLADNDRDRMLRATVSRDYLLTVRDLALKSQEAKKNSSDGFSAEVDLPAPPGFDLRYAGFKESEVRFDAATSKLITTVELLDKDYKSLLVAGADPAFRDALNQLYVASAKFKVSPMWLVWFYILCTLGELCLSPVGLSMVSKLAPAKFATTLMGMWLLTSFFGNFLAGFAGESYGSVHPAKYFLFIAVVVGGASLVCLMVVKTTKALMHGVD